MLPFFQLSFQMSHSNLKNFRPKPLCLPPVDFMGEDLQGLTWPETPRARGSPPSRLWAENPYVTSSTGFRNNRPSPPVEASKSIETMEQESNKENQYPQDHATNRATSSSNRKFGTQKTSRQVLQELDINSLSLPSKVSRFANSGL